MYKTIRWRQNVMIHRWDVCGHAEAELKTIASLFSLKGSTNRGRRTAIEETCTTSDPTLTLSCAITAPARSVASAVNWLQMRHTARTLLRICTSALHILTNDIILPAGCTVWSIELSKNLNKIVAKWATKNALKGKQMTCHRYVDTRSSFRSVNML